MIATAEEPLRVICAWCHPDAGREAAARGEIVSHGMCPAHAVVWATQIEEFRAGFGDRAEAADSRPGVVPVPGTVAEGLPGRE